MAYARLDEGTEFFGWRCVAVKPAVEFGPHWPFGPLFTYPAKRYVFIREVGGKSFNVNVILGDDIPEDERSERAVDQLAAADDALDQLREWPVAS